MADFMHRSCINALIEKASSDEGSVFLPIDKTFLKFAQDDIDVITGPEGLKKINLGEAIFAPRAIVQAEGVDGKIYSIHLNEDKEGKLVPTAYEVREKTTEEREQILNTRDQITSGLS